MHTIAIEYTTSTVVQAFDFGGLRIFFWTQFALNLNF